MTKEQREAYRHVLEAWIDGELEFARDGKNFERWDSEWPPICNFPPDHYRRTPKPRTGYAVMIGGMTLSNTVEEAKKLRPHAGFIIVRCEEVLE